MIGRRVTDSRRFIVGEITKWEPLGASMCDVLVSYGEGLVCWYSSADLIPIDDKGPLPSRAEAREAARLKALDDLRAIREQHVRDFHKPWPGAEHGKTIMGRAFDAAIKDLENKK